MDNMEFPYTIRKMKPDLTRIQTLFSLFSMSPDYLKRDIKIFLEKKNKESH